jgi:enamine deaminase RidA (YjgF/YER057c/UK114 family)
MGAQARQIFVNIQAVLAEAGATMEDVVKITAFLTDMS